ncbi:hypothetical protein FQR65_LT00168 [Abscondita terminalis]|nr:hypothetical protein FQR65_LT00168 [Abscondita terminalis]
MKTVTLLCMFAYIYLTFGKLQSITEDRSLNMCMYALTRQIGELTFVLTDRDFTIIPKQSGTKYLVVNTMTSKTIALLPNSNIVIFIKNETALVNVMDVLQLGRFFIQALNYKILIVTTSSNMKPIFMDLWRRKMVYVAIVHYQERTDETPFLYTSNPYDRSNLCGQTPNAIVAQKCTGTSFIFEHKNLNRCPIIFVTVSEKAYNSGTLLSVIPKYIMTEVEKSFNTSVTFYSNLNDFSTIKRYLVIMFLCDTAHQLWDRVTIHTDDVIWVTPVYHRPTNVFDNITWVMITLIFLTTSMFWWISVSIETNNYSVNQMCLSFLNVWCLTLCGCIKAPPALRFLRSIFVIYLFYVMIIQAAFKSNLIQTLTTSQEYKPIKNIRDAANSDLTLTVAEEIVEVFFVKNLPQHSLYTQIRNKLVHNYRGLEDVIDYKNCNHVTIRSYLEEYQFYKNTKVNYFIDNSLTGYYKIYIGLAFNHFFTKSLRRITQLLIEAGLHSKIVSDFCHEYYRRFDNKINETSSLIVLTVKDLYWVFFIWGIGIFTSCIVFVIEKFNLSQNIGASLSNNTPNITKSLNKMNLLLVTIAQLICLNEIVYGKIVAIDEQYVLCKCLSFFVQQFFDNDIPLTFISLDDSTFLVPKQAYMAINLENLNKINFSTDTQFVLFANDFQDLHKFLNVLIIKDFNMAVAPKSRILIVTNSLNAKLVFRRMWKRRIINVAIITYGKENIPAISMSNPFEKQNLCGKIPRMVITQKCRENAVTLRYNKYNNFNNCSMLFLNVYRSNHISNIISRLVFSEIEKKFKAHILSGSDYYELKTISKFLVVMFISAKDDRTDKVEIFTDDIVWVSPVFKRIVTVTQNIFDNFIWGLIALTFLTMSIVWWGVTNLVTKNRKWNQMCSYVLDVWSLTICGVVKTPPSLTYLRSIFLLYLFFVVVLQTAFKSKITNHLTLSEYWSNIKTIEDVANSQLFLKTHYEVSKMFEQNISENILYTKIKKKMI